MAWIKWVALIFGDPPPPPQFPGFAKRRAALADPVALKATYEEVNPDINHTWGFGFRNCFQHWAGGVPRKTCIIWEASSWAPSPVETTTEACMKIYSHMQVMLNDASSWTDTWLTTVQLLSCYARSNGQFTRQRKLS